MPNNVPPVPTQGAVTGGGSIATPVWSDWFKQVLARIGGNVVTYNLDELWTYIQDRIEKPGVIKAYGGTIAPAGYLLCDGAAVSRTTYAALFTALGVLWGPGDGSTTFNVPDLRGRFLVGKDSGTFTPVAGIGGSESTPLPNHVHANGGVTGAPSATTNVTVGAVAVASAGHTHTLTGNTSDPTTNPDVATLPPYAVVTMVIKT